MVLAGRMALLLAQLAGIVQCLGAALMLGALAWAIFVVMRGKSRERET